MRKAVALTVALLCLCSLAAAQTGATGAPNVLVLLREDIKQGRMGAHDTLVFRRMKAASAAGAQVAPFIGGVAATGNTNERLELTMLNSLADWEKDNAAQEKIDDVTLKDAEFVQTTADVHQNARTLVCQLDKQLSYAPDKLDFANAHYVIIRTLRFKPGYAKDYFAVHKDNITEHERVGLTDYWAIYKVSYGAPYDTFLFIQPVKSLAELDADFDEVHKAVARSIWDRYSQTAREGMLFEERTIMQVRPVISQPPQAYIAANPDFWQAKTQSAATMAALQQRTKVKKTAVKQAKE